MIEPHPQHHNIIDRLVAYALNYGGRYRTLARIGRIMDRRVDWLAERIFNPSTVFSEAWVSGGTFAVGLWIAASGGTAQALPSDVALVLQTVAPREAFAAAWIALGAMGAIAARCGSLRLRQWISWLVAVAWMFATIVLLSRNLYSLTTVYCPFMVIGAAWAYLRLGVRDG
jgi:hypothetical protein